MSKIGDFFSRLTKKVPEGHSWESVEYHSGTASYCYITLGDTKIFDGEFKFKRPFATGFDKAEGYFERDKKEGEWYFERKSTRNNKKMYAKFEHGHVRELELVNDDYTIDYVSRTTLTMTINENDRVVGNIQGVIEAGNFIGNCDEDGFPDGIWSLRTQDDNGHDIEERETWEHGHLVKAVKIDHLKKLESTKSGRLRETVNFFLDDAVSSLMNIVRRGTSNPHLHIYRHRTEEEKETAQQ